MIKHILLPTDFSACSLNALEYALRFIKEVNPEARLTILSAYNVPLAYSDINISFGVGDSESDLTAYIDQGFKELKEKLPQLKEFKYETVKICNFVKEAVEHYCDDNAVDLIIMGTSGATGLKEVFIGTNTQRIIEVSEVPVLAIPDKVQFKSLENIGLSTDYESMKPEVLAPLKAINIAFNANLHLAHIENNLVLEQDKSMAARNLDTQLKEVKHQFHYLVDEDLEEGLNTFIENEQIDLLAVYPRKKNFFEKIFTRSQTKSIIYHTDIPLLALK